MKTTLNTEKPLNLVSQDTHKDIWVVYSGRADLAYLKLLKEGFRHCFLIYRNGKRQWVAIDGLSSHLEVEVLDVEGHINLPHWFKNQGFIVQSVQYLNERRFKPAPWSFFTCVEVIKRFLNIHEFFIFTPYQLYRYLEKQGYEDLSSTPTKGEVTYG